MTVGADYVRRIYLDGREFPENATSLVARILDRCEWKGETLVVTTTRLTPAFLTSKGQPLSADATIIEHFYFDDRGYLHADMWIDDPVNYTRRPFYPRVYDRDFSPTVISPRSTAIPTRSSAPCISRANWRSFGSGRRSAAELNPFNDLQCRRQDLSVPTTHNGGWPQSV